MQQSGSLLLVSCDSVITEVKGKRLLCLHQDSRQMQVVLCRVAAMEKAEAEKVQVVKAAEGNAEAQYLAGVGVARQRQAIVNGLRDSIKNFSSDISDVGSRDVIEMVRPTA